ncbi:hypothetical protein ACVR05_06920 [Streptococcus caprae]|uniref:Uncharacterized protein n=1 Tax=Streptococcus caprae TaxID=1640501 RepID=A0ABV8CWW8_9STRE
MKKKVTQTQMGILSLLVLVLLGGLFILKDQFITHGESQIKTSLDRIEIKAERARLKAAEEAIETLEKKQTQENLDKAQKALDALTITTESTKSNLQARIDKISKIITANQALAMAEKMVSELETNPTLDNLVAAQEAIDKVTNDSSKGRLQSRLDAVRVKIEEAEASQVSEVVTRSSEAGVTQATVTEVVEEDEEEEYIYVPTPPVHSESVVTEAVTSVQNQEVTSASSNDRVVVPNTEPSVSEASNSNQ